LLILKFSINIKKITSNPLIENNIDVKKNILTLKIPQQMSIKK